MGRILDRHSHTAGFTLIELLVVVSIIGLLSSVVLSSLNTARKKGTHIHAVQTIKSYYNAVMLAYDSNGQFYWNNPLSTGYCMGINPGENCGFFFAGVAWGGGLNGTDHVGFNNWISAYVNSHTPVAVAQSTDYSFKGVVYKCNTTVNSKCVRSTLLYAVDLDKSCQPGVMIYDFMGFNICQLTIQ